MKKVILLLVIVAVIYVVLHRQRLFLHDVVGSVTRNGVKEPGAQVFINYSNDVLLENDTAPAYILIVQHGGNIGTPAVLKCVHWLLCQTDADNASLITAAPASNLKSMSSKAVEFTDADGRDVVVALH